MGITRSCSLFMDALFDMVHFGRDLDPVFLLGPALLLVSLETILLGKLKTARGC